MKKKLVLKKWVEMLLIGILFVMLVVIASDCDSTFTFAIIHIIAGCICFLIGSLLTNYGRNFD